MKKVSIIDIGSNSIKHYIFEISGDGHDLVYFERFSDAQFGKDLAYIRSDSVDRGLAILHERRAYNDEMQVSRCSLIGTAVFRSASNASEVVKKIEAVFDTSLEVLTHEKEAYYLWKGFTDLLPQGMIFGAVNTGGGSTEVVIGNTQEIIADYQISVGVNPLKEKFSQGKRVDWKGMERYIEAEVDIPQHDISCFFVTGVLDFLQVVGKRIGFVFDPCDIVRHPIKVSYDTYAQQLDQLRAVPMDTLMSYYSKDPSYALGFPTGQTAYLMVAKKLGVDYLIPSENQFTDGVVLEMII